jgi:dolichol-phosphate mannosyltransferase
MKTVSVLLPTYNEAENIVPLLEEILTSVSQLREILIVDDNSPDHTAEIVRSWIKKNKRDQTVRVIVRLTDHGLTGSISEGIQSARGSIVVWMDADFSHPPKYINALTEAVRDGTDIAVCSRYISGGKPTNTKNSADSSLLIPASILANKILRIVFGLDFYDYTSGFIAVRKDVVKRIPLHGSYGEYFIDFIVRAYRTGYRIKEIPFISEPRRAGYSKTATSLPGLIRRMFQYTNAVLSLVRETKRHAAG